MCQILVSLLGESCPLVGDFAAKQRKYQTSLLPIGRPTGLRISDFVPKKHVKCPFFYAFLQMFNNNGGVKKIDDSILVGQGQRIFHLFFSSDCSGFTIRETTKTRRTKIAICLKFHVPPFKFRN
jgi:hypothetical protein